MEKKSIFSESRLWVAIAMVLLYIKLTDLFVDYVINRELDGIEQMILSFVFLVVSFYTGKGVYLLFKKKRTLNNLKNKQND